MKGTFTKAAGIVAITVLVSMGAVTLGTAGLGEGSRSVQSQTHVTGLGEGSLRLQSYSKTQGKSFTKSSLLRALMVFLGIK
jgi:hypothetical protein